MEGLSLNQISVTAEKSEKMEGGLLLTGPRVKLELPAVPIRYLYSGWHSWSLTAWIGTDYNLRTQRPSILHPMQIDPLYARDHRPNGSWYGAVELPGGGIVLLGSLGLDSHVALNGNILEGWNEGGQLDNPSCEWFLATGDETGIFSRYAGLLGERLGKGHIQKPPRVWCSWYSLNTEIHESQMLKILNDLGDLPFDVFQVDDGWQVSIGDWEPNAKFPSGMSGLATRIRATGRKAGLWLAPLIVVPSSNTYHQHRDWLLHDKSGRLVSAGFNWGEQLYALDTTHPGALEWLAALMKKIRLWGYDYAKLDFLSAGALPGKRHMDMPREAAYRNGLKVIRTALDDAYLLTCAAPILPSIGLCDALRVGPDVASHFTSQLDDSLLMNFSVPGVRNALRTTLHRLWLAPLLHTDPDVVYFRTRQNNLTAEQKSLMQDLATICNVKATSDIPSWLTDSERTLLHAFLEAAPRVSKIGHVAYRIGDRQVDFSQFITMPPLPGPLTNLVGAIPDSLAPIKLLMKILDKLGKNSIKHMLEENPV